MVKDERIRTVRSEAGSKGGKARVDLLKQNVKQNSSNHPSKPLTLSSDSSSGKRKKGVKGEEGEGFEAFWRAYPKKVGKQEAVKAWAKLKPDAALQARILAAVEAAKQLPGWLKDGGMYIKDPSGWLNGRRWEDEATAVAEKAAETADAQRAVWRRDAEARKAADAAADPAEVRRALDRLKNGG